MHPARCLCALLVTWLRSQEPQKRTKQQQKKWNKNLHIKWIFLSSVIQMTFVSTHLYASQRNGTRLLLPRTDFSENNERPTNAHFKSVFITLMYLNAHQMRETNKRKKMAYLWNGLCYFIISKLLQRIFQSTISTIHSKLIRRLFSTVIWLCDFKNDTVDNRMKYVN